MKLLGSVLAIIILLFVGGLVFSGVTEPKVTQIELTKDVKIEPAKPEPVAIPAPTPAPVAVPVPVPVPVTPPVSTAPAE